MSRCNKVEEKSAAPQPLFSNSFLWLPPAQLFPFSLFISQFLFHISPWVCWCVSVYIILLQREPITIERAAGDADASECHWLRLPILELLVHERIPADLIHLSAPEYLTDTADSGCFCGFPFSPCSPHRFFIFFF